jgi:hypothetical protein
MFPRDRARLQKKWMPNSHTPPHEEVPELGEPLALFRTRSAACVTSVTRLSEPGLKLPISEEFNMMQIKVRWGDLGSPTQPGDYRFGPHMVRVTPGDIKLAKGNPDAIFVAIHPEFFSDETPYLLTGVEFPGHVIGRE